MWNYKESQRIVAIKNVWNKVVKNKKFARKTITWYTKKLHKEHVAKISKVVKGSAKVIERMWSKVTKMECKLKRQTQPNKE